MNESTRRAGFAYSMLNPQAPSVVIALHGLGGDRTQPLGAFGDFGSDIALLAPDLRAHGETVAPVSPERLTFESLADDVTGLLRELGQADKPVYVSGISMGAAIALTLLQRPGLDIRGASLVRPAFSEEAVPDNLAPMVMAAALLRTHGPVAGAAAMRETPEYQQLATLSAAAAASLIEQFAKPSASERVARLAVIPAQGVRFEVGLLKGRDVPVQVVGSPRDPIHPLPLARQWAARIPGTTLVEVPARDPDPDGYAEAIRTSVVTHAQACLP